MTAVDRPLPGVGSSGETTAPFADAPDAVAEDRALLERLRAGEDSAFGELFARHSAAVRRLAFGLVSDRAEAEDLTAEAFFRVLQALRRGAGPVDNVRGYLLIVTRRVAWEWRIRRRDVPVTDEELTHRAGAGPDTAGQSTERNLITRAFTSLPERWRSVLWKVEVEGERPAVVANNFGLSANATAALARRARQGLRAAYLQAHLVTDRSGAGCRSVLEKLGAYTAGSIKGGERRRIRAHLITCPHCTAMYAELRDVCAGLRAHAGVLTAPVVAVAGWQLATGGSGVAASFKALLAGAKAQLALVASASTVVGVLGVIAGPWGPGVSDAVAVDDFNGKRGVELIISGTQPTKQSTPESIVLTTGVLSTAAVVPGRRTRPPGQGSTSPDLEVTPANNPAGAEPAQPAAEQPYDPNAPVIFRETTVQQRSETHGDYMLIYEITSVTEVNAAAQTKTSTSTRKYTKPASTFEVNSTTDSPRSETPPESVRPTSDSPSTTPTTAEKAQPLKGPATNPR